MYEEYEDEVIRKHNRVLRKVNKGLRRTLKHHKMYADNIFVELCENDSLAIEALERIRKEGNLDCDSDDYEYIIFECLRALKLNKV